MSFSSKGISSPCKNKEGEVVGLKCIGWVCNYQSKKKKKKKQKQKLGKNTHKPLVVFL